MRRQVVTFGLAALVVLAFIAMTAPLISPFSPQRMNIVHRLNGPNLTNLMGTDEFGRDVFSRILYGARVSLSIGFMVSALAIVLGTCLGLVAGYVRRLDSLIMRLVDALMAFPDILLSIALMAALGAGMTNVVLALGVVYAPRVARIVRAIALMLREQQFVEASVALGAGRGRIIWIHLLPNLFSPIIVQATFVFSYAILTEAALSFLGVGVPPTTPSWGNMIASAQQVAQQAPWLIWGPGIAIGISVVALQVVGDGLRDALDPRMRRVL